MVFSHLFVRRCRLFSCCKIRLSGIFYLGCIGLPYAQGTTIFTDRYIASNLRLSAALFMMDFDPAYNRMAIAQIGQRIGATLIDFVACEFLSQLIQALIWNNNDGTLNLFIFAPVWFLFRVLVSSKAQGQSFGRWLLSTRVVDMNYGKTSGIADLLKRESVIFLGIMILLSTFTTTLIVFAWLPLAVDVIFAIADPVKRQMLHDRLGGTIVIVSRKGFELDRKLAKLFGQVSKRTTELYQERSFGRDRDDDLDYQPRNSARNQVRNPPRSRNQSRYEEDYRNDSDRATNYEERDRPVSKPSRARRPRRRR
jgi:uncharacterized RDD family membrane protein YckC